MQASEIRWASRWDTYLLMMDDQIHWFSIINSVMIVLFLSGMVSKGQQVRTPWSDAGRGHRARHRKGGYGTALSRRQVRTGVTGCVSSRGSCAQAQQKSGYVFGVPRTAHEHANICRCRLP